MYIGTKKINFIMNNSILCPLGSVILNNIMDYRIWIIVVLTSCFGSTFQLILNKFVLGPV